MYKRILLPTDGSESAEKAAAHAIELARSAGAELVALYVIDTSSFVSLPETFMWENVRELLAEEGEKALESVKRQARQNNVPVKTLLKEGSPAREIVNTAEDEKADLIVMGTSGRTGLDRFLLGSVSEKVLRAAHTPVMIIK
ncbi:MAG: universal stress protein [Methanobacteriota archaeon]|nr:MAG: universal stress protein [Euryarchaeota archaeon]